MKIRIRDASTADLPIISEIYRESVLSGTSSYELEPPSDEEMASRFATITGQNYPYIIAEDDKGKVLGYAYASAFRTRPAWGAITMVVTPGSPVAVRRRLSPALPLSRPCMEGQRSCRCVTRC